MFFVTTEKVLMHLMGRMRDAPKHFIMHCTDLTTKNYPFQNANGAEFETLVLDVQA